MLVANSAAWNADYVAAPDAETRRARERWRHPEIKQTLRDETQSRCAYCEGFVDDVSYSHVEHILPKLERPELSHTWNNLTSACGRCNGAKDDYYSELVPLLNPYDDDFDVSTRLSFAGALVVWTAGDEQAELTVKTIDLNRAELLMSRARRVGSVLEMLSRWRTADEPLKSTIANGIRVDLERGEFGASIEALLRSQGFSVPTP